MLCNDTQRQLHKVQKNAMQSSILGVAVCGCVSDAGVESSNVHAAPVCGGVGRCVCESHVAFISISSVQCVLHFYFIDGEGGGQFHL